MKSSLAIRLNPCNERLDLRTNAFYSAMTAHTQCTPYPGFSANHRLRHSVQVHNSAFIIHT